MRPNKNVKYGCQILISESMKRLKSLMAVDLIPISLLMAGILTVAVMVIVVAASEGKRFKRRVKIIGFTVCAALATVYLWRYHRVELWFGSAADRGDAVACYRLGKSYLWYGRGAPL